MKRSILVVFSLLLWGFSSNAQNLDWVRQIANVGAPQVASDQFGNLYFSGFQHTTDSLNFFGSIVASPQTNHPAIYIVKCDSATNIIWTKFFTYSPSYSKISDISIDQNGNCIITGFFSDSLFVGYDTLTDVTLDPTGFLISLDSMGNLNWYKKLSSTCELNPSKVVIDNSNNIYVNGRFFCNGQFDTIAVNTLGFENYFIAKFSSDGAGIWVKTGTGRQMLTLDISSNNIIRACAVFGDSLNLENIMIPAIGARSNIALIGYDTAGTLTQVLNIGHGISNMLTPYITCLSTDAMDNIYISGSYDSTFQFLDTIISGFRAEDVFILKLTTGGTRIAIKSFSGTQNERSHDLITDDNGISYLCGSFIGGIFIDGRTYFTAGMRGVFTCRLDSSLNVDWVMPNDMNLNSEPSSLSLAANNTLYVTGTMDGIFQWGPWNLNTIGSTDVWVAHITDLIMGVNSPKSNSLTRDISVYPNPTTGKFNVTFGKSMEHGRVEVVNILNQVIFRSELKTIPIHFTKEFDLSIQNGTYFLRVVFEDGSIAKKIIINR